MTIEQYIEKLKRRQMITEDILYISASTVHAEMSKRIFEEGKAADGSAIGDYNSTDPLYIDPDKAPVKFTPKGKTGRTKFKNGKAHRTGYFDSYKAFRADQRRPTDKVNLELFGMLKSDFTNSLQKDNNNTWVARIKASENQKKAIGNQRRFRKAVFALTKEERELFHNVAQAEFTRRFNA